MKNIKKKFKAFIVKIFFTPVRALELSIAHVEVGLRIDCISSMNHGTHQSIFIHYTNSTRSGHFHYNDEKLFSSERTLLEAMIK